MRLSLNPPIPQNYVTYPEETEVGRVTNHAETVGFIFQETFHGREGHDKCLKREEADQSGGICG